MKKVVRLCFQSRWGLREKGTSESTLKAILLVRHRPARTLLKPRIIATDRLRSYRAAINVIGNGAYLRDECLNETLFACCRTPGPC